MARTRQVGGAIVVAFFVATGGPGAEEEPDSTARWERGTSDESPPYSESPCIAFDPVREQVVMLGGMADELRRDTWTWNGSEWTKHPSIDGGPAGCFGNGMTYDPERRAIVMLATDWRDAFEWENSLWEWTGQQWRRLTRILFTQGKRADENGLVVRGEEGELRGEVLSWENDIWTSLDVEGPTPPQMVSPAMVYDSARDQIVLVGTVSDEGDMQTWLLDLSPNHDVRGGGCGCG